MNIKLILFAPLSLLVTLGLFYLMTSILHQDNLFDKKPMTTIAADFLMPDRTIETFVKITKPEKPKPRKEPQFEQPSFKVSSGEIKSEKLTLELPTIETDINISMTMPEASADSDYVPLLKVAPIYPQRAANRNIEGYVIVEYTISVSGQVTDVSVVESKPTGVFDRAAIDAAKRFKYKPRKSGGKKVAVKAVKNKFTFLLENQ